MASITFFADGLSFELDKPRKTSSWIKTVIKKEKHSLVALTYIFCSDACLLKLNQEYLRHHTLTDIITFNLGQVSGQVNGEVYISIDRVKQNAIDFVTTFDQELHRVIIHGVLHLVGYGDKKSGEKTIMRKKEEAYLSLRR
jgi:probable rRNA maturation factor